MADVAVGVGAAAAAMGAALVGVGVASANVGRDIDGSMGAIRAQTGMTTDDTNTLREAWHSWAKEGGHDIREIAAAYSSIAVAGNDVEHGLNVMEAAMRLADATGFDLGSTAYLVGQYLLKVGKDSQYADKYVDLFAIAIQNTQIGLGDLQNYLFRMTPAFEQFGASGETNVAILSRLYQAGIRGANLYSGMGTIMMDFATAGDISAAAIERFAVATHDANGVALSNEEIMFNVAAAMADYGDQTEVARWITDNMNQTQQAAWFEFKNLHEEIQDEVIPSFTEYGVAAEMAATRVDGVESGLRSMRGAFTFLKDTVWDFIRIPVGEAFEGIAVKMSSLATTFAPMLGGAIGGLVGILTGAEGASDKFAESVGNIAEEINRQLPVFLERGIDIVVNLIAGVASALPTLVEGVVEIIPTVAHTILDALPELITAGIMVVVALINGMSEMLPDLVPIAIEGIITIVNAFMNNLPMLVDAAIGLIMALAAALTDPANLAMLAEAAPQLIRFFALYLGGKAALAFVGKATYAIVGKVKAGIYGGKALMGKAGMAMVGFFKSGMTKGGIGLKSAGGTMVKGVGKGATAAGKALKAIGKAVGALFSKGVKAGAKIGKLGGKITKGLGAALKGGKGVMSKAGDGIAKSFTGALKGKGGVGAAAKAGKGLLAAIGPKGWIAGGVVALGVVAYRNREKIGAFFNNMGERAREAFPRVAEAVDGAVERIRGLVSSVRENAVAIVDNFKEGFDDRRDQGFGVVASFAGSVLDVMSDKLPLHFGVAADMMGSFIDGFTSRRAEGYGLVRSFAGGVLDAAKSGLAGMREIGENTIMSFSNGFASRREEGMGVVRSFFGGIADAGRNILGISSPSKVFRYFADMSLDGYIGTLKDRARDVYKTVEDVFGGVGKYASTQFDIGVNSLNGYSHINAATEMPSQPRGGDTYIYPTIAVKFEDVDQVSKLIQLFDGLPHGKIVEVGVS